MADKITRHKMEEMEPQTIIMRCSTVKKVGQRVLKERRRIHSQATKIMQLSKWGFPKAILTLDNALTAD